MQKINKNLNKTDHLSYDEYLKCTNVSDNEGSDSDKVCNYNHNDEINVNFDDQSIQSTKNDITCENNIISL